MSGKTAIHEMEDDMNATATRAPTTSERESLEAELVEHAELLSTDAARLRYRRAELNRELFSACGWTADLSRRLEQPGRPGRGVAGVGEIPPGLIATRSAVPPEDTRPLERRGLMASAAVTLVPWVLVACLLYVCWRLIT
jgi:hypothetical protein